MSQGPAGRVRDLVGVVAPQAWPVVLSVAREQDHLLGVLPVSPPTSPGSPSPPPTKLPHLGSVLKKTYRLAGTALNSPVVVAVV